MPTFGISLTTAANFLDASSKTLVPPPGVSLFAQTHSVGNTFQTHVQRHNVDSETVHTGSSTDFACAGKNDFLPVKDLGGALRLLRQGSFQYHADSSQFQDAAGNVLMGVPLIDRSGNVLAVPDVIETTTLTPVEMSLKNVMNPTSKVQFRGVLPFLGAAEAGNERLPFQVYDARGITHNGVATFDKQANAVWTLATLTFDGGGTVLDAEIPLAFSERGGYCTTADGATNAVVWPNANTQASTLTLTFKGLQEAGAHARLEPPVVDGYGAENILSFEARGNECGVLIENGDFVPIYKIPVATCANPNFLLEGSSTNLSGAFMFTINSHAIQTQVQFAAPEVPLPRLVEFSKITQMVGVLGGATAKQHAATDKLLNQLLG